MSQAFFFLKYNRLQSGLNSVFDSVLVPLAPLKTAATQFVWLLLVNTDVRSDFEEVG